MAKKTPRTPKGVPHTPRVPQTKPPTALGRPTGRKRWLYRLAAATLVPAALLLMLELGLRLFGYGYPTAFFVASSRTQGGDGYVSNYDFSRRFFPPGLERAPTPLALPAGTYRIFVLGESAAQGFPDPSASFSRILEVMLRERYPGVSFEIVNTAMTAINSHAILPIARECAGLQPDLFIAYIGNNEVVGPFGAANVIGSYSPTLRLIRSNLALKSTRTGQLLSNVVRLGSKHDVPQFWGGMEMFVKSQVRAGDAALQTTYTQFRQNLTDICQAGVGAGVPVLVCTVPVNLRDCAPFASLHAADLALEQLDAWKRAYEAGTEREAVGKYADAIARYEEAARIDDQFADLQFRLGRCYAALGKVEEARSRYSLARDLDTVRFRADTTINDAIRQVTGDGAAKQIHLVDVERDFAAASPDGIPGEDVFFEHVHMNFHGNYRLARSILHKLEEVLPPSIRTRAKDGQDLPSEQTCAERLVYTGWDQYQEVAQVREMFRQPPFVNQFDGPERERRWARRLQDLRQNRQPEELKKAAAQYQKAVQDAPGDWMIGLHYVRVLVESGQVNDAIGQCQAIVQQHPYLYAAHYQLGTLLLRARKPAEARASFQAALTAAPEFDEAQYGLADVLASDGNVEQAIAAYAALVEKASDRSEALVKMANLLSQVGRPKEAKERLQEAVRLHPDDALLHVHVGKAWAAEGALEPAIAEFETALRLQPNWPEMVEYLDKLKKLRNDRQR